MTMPSRVVVKLGNNTIKKKKTYFINDDPKLALKNHDDQFVMTGFRNHDGYDISFTFRPQNIHNELSAIRCVIHNPSVNYPWCAVAAGAQDDCWTPVSTEDCADNATYYRFSEYESHTYDYRINSAGSHLVVRYEDTNYKEWVVFIDSDDS